MKTKKLLVMLTGFLLAGFLILSSHSIIKAAGGPHNLDVSAAPTSLPVGQTTTISLFTYNVKCSDGYTYREASLCQSPYQIVSKEGAASVGSFSVTVSGGGNTLSTNSLATDSSGHGSFTLRSTAAGTKTITVYDSSIQKSLSVTFTAAAASTTPTTRYYNTSTTATTPPPPTVAAPTVAQVKVAGKAVPTTTPVTVKVGQPLTLSGKAVANGVVTLYIHSKERIVTTKADKNGAWAYTIAQLPVGSHYVEAQVTDPSNKQSAKTKLLDFTVKPTKSLATAKTTSSINPWSMIVLPTILAVIVVAGAVYGLRRFGRKKPSQTHDATSSAPPAELSASPGTENSENSSEQDPEPKS